MHALPQRLLRAWSMLGLLCLAWLIAVPRPARADDAGPLLDAMAKAMRTLDYQGAFTYQHAGRVDTLRIFHAGGARERERLVSLNGPRSELVRDGANVTCTQPDGTTVVYASTAGRGLMPLLPAADTRALDEHYEVRRIGEDRVAGYRADVVDVAPRDRLRYGYRFWLERDTRLLLRSMVTDGERRPLEQLMFVSLEIGTAPTEADLVPQKRGDAATPVTAPEIELEVRGTPYWQVVPAPPGFHFVSARRPKQGPEGAEHLVYSDGLATVSIYVEPRGDAVAGYDTLAGRGTVNVFGRVMEDWRVTVLGEVPVATVHQIGNNLRRATTDD